MEEKQYLYDRLREYCEEEDHYPFHMPGHKRRMGSMTDPFRIDITEIDGFDDLHHPSDLLKDAQERAAALYGSEETYFLINGSTAGLLSAIGACAHARNLAVPAFGSRKIVMARNCHRSVYHAVYLNRLEPVYLYPEPYGAREQEEQQSLQRSAAWKTADGNAADGNAADENAAGGNAADRNDTAGEESVRHGAEMMLNGRIRPRDVEEALSRAENVCAVVITSPTYDGVISDVRRIASIAHRHGIPLIVDEAHGAHFGFHSAFPDSSVHLGADLVIHSLHKTLPSLTQTALLHVNGNYTDRELVRRMLNIYQTSSPSYVLMASIDECIRRMQHRGERDLEQLSDMLDRFYVLTQELEVLALVRTDDPSRIVIGSGTSRLSGLQICDILREQYHLELEMAGPAYALALAAAGDDEEGFVRLAQALLEIDRELALCARFPERRGADWLEKYKEYRILSGQMKRDERPPETGIRGMRGIRPEAGVPLYRAWDMPASPKQLGSCRGCVSGEFVYLYPPGLPMIVPGEVVEEDFIQTVQTLREKGFLFMGCRDENMDHLMVLEAAQEEQDPQVVFRVRP